MAKIETKDLLLRAPAADDAAGLFDVVGDPEVTKYMSMDPFPDEDYTRKCLERWAALKDEDVYVFVIEEKLSGRVIGMINTCGIADGLPEIGYCLEKSFWGKGYMTQALQAFTAMLFREGREGSVAEAAIANVGSCRVIEKCGFELIRQELQSLCESKPEEIPVNVYRLYKNDQVLK